MPGKPKILFIGDYSRFDYVQMLHSAKAYFEFYFIYFVSPVEENNKLYKSYGKALYWSDFRSANDLLSSIKPAKVLFLYIDTYHHVVLNLACKHFNIPAFHLEHGLRADYVLSVAPTTSAVPAKGASFSFQKITGFYKGSMLVARIKARLFLLASIKELPSAEAEFAKSFIDFRRSHSYVETFAHFNSPKRLAAYYISFSERVFSIHQKYDFLPAQQKVFYIGIPYFDKLANLTPASPVKAILFIDQPMAEQGLLHWTKAYKNQFIQDLMKMCSESHYHLYVKPHPKQDLNLWAKAEQSSLCEIIDDEQLLVLAPSIPLILGFYSTLLMPFAAFKHTAIVTYEKHPAGDYLVSKPLVEAGVAHPIYDLEELHGILQDVEALHQKQLPHKEKFTEEWMYKFDGKAGERLRDILLSNDL